LFDVIVVSHVLEHLPSLADVFPRFHRMLTPNGRLIVLVPNCGGIAATREGVHWGPFANEAHLLSFDAAFFRRNLPPLGFAVDCYSYPYPPQLKPGVSGDLSGDELCIVARRTAGADE
jgi:SAM-dependent methyltransferase